MSKQEVDNAVGDLAAKKSTVNPLRPTFSRLEDLESFKGVYAPFTGVITQRNTDIGMLINAGNGGSNSSLFTLAQIDPIRVFVAVPQTYAPSIHVGMQACLELAGVCRPSFCGLVARTADSIDVVYSHAEHGSRCAEPFGNSAAGRLCASSLRSENERSPAFSADQCLAVPAWRAPWSLSLVPDNRIQLKPVAIGRDLGSTVEVLGGTRPEGRYRREPAG